MELVIQSEDSRKKSGRRGSRPAITAKIPNEQTSWEISPSAPVMTPWARASVSPAITPWRWTSAVSSTHFSFNQPINRKNYQRNHKLCSIKINP